MNLGKCKLCQRDADLQESHIFPRSYFKFIKSGSGQLLEVKIDKDTEPVLSNLDPKEYLFCRECEQFLSNKYEKYGTQLFRKAHNIERQPNYVKIKSFNYTKFYLYIISILWRASISTIKRYEHITFDEKMNVRFAKCIIKETTRMAPSIKLDHFFKIALVRLKDSSNQLDDQVIRKIFIDLNLRKTNNIDDGITYFFAIEGILILINFNSSVDLHTLRTRKITNQMIDKTYIKIPFVDISEIKEIADIISIASEKIIKYNSSFT